MSLTENYIVPDFYYTDSGIPTLYNTNNNSNNNSNNISNSQKFVSNIGTNLNIVQNTRTQSFTPILNQSTSIISSSSQSQSQSSPSTSSSILFKNSLSSKSYNYSNNHSQQKTTTLSSTPILKCCKSKTTTITTAARSTTSREIPTTAINFNRLRNRNNDNNNNNCDKINQNSFKINTPKKLLIKRGTIYQTDPQQPPPPPPPLSSSSLPIQTTQQNIVVANTVTGLVATGKNIQKTSNNRYSNNCVNSYYNNNGNINGNNNYNNCGNNENQNNEILNWGFINDKQRKTYVNNQIKKFQNINEQRLRGNDQNHLVPQLSQSSRSQFQSTNSSSGNHLYCPKNGSIIIKKFQHNNNKQQQQQQKQMDNRITYYKDHRNYEIFSKNKSWIQNNIKNNNWNNCSSSDFIYWTDFYNINTISSDVDNNTLNNNSTNRDHNKEDDDLDDNENTYNMEDAVLNQNKYDDDLNDF